MISYPSSEQEVSSTLSPGAAQPRRCKGSRWEALFLQLWNRCQYRHLSIYYIIKGVLKEATTFAERV